MVIRDVAPFDDKQWDQLMENMKKGPTDNERKVVKEAQERARKIKRENF